MEKAIEHLNRQYDLMVRICEKLYPFTEARLAKFSGYRQAIIDLEEYAASSAINEPIDKEDEADSGAPPSNCSLNHTD